MLCVVYSHETWNTNCGSSTPTAMHSASISSSWRFPPSLTLMVALLLLAIGFYVIASMVFGIGPFG